jgi:hypothetical protein
MSDKLLEEITKLGAERQNLYLVVTIQQQIAKNGEDWGAIAQYLNENKKTTATGLKWTEKRLKQWANRPVNEGLLARDDIQQEIDTLWRKRDELRAERKRARNRKASQPSQGAETTEAEQPAVNDSQPDEPGKTQSDTIPPAWLRIVREMMQEEVKAMVNAMMTKNTRQAKFANVAALTTEVAELPPRTPRVDGGRKFRGERATLPGCRVDKSLFDLFEAEREKENRSASELMQAILWHHFGKPKLSFEDDSENVVE